MKKETRRYAEGPSAEVFVEVEAGSDVLWPLVSDIQLPARFSSEFLGAQWVDSDGPKLGARFEGRNKRGDAEWTTTSTIDVFEPGRAFGWVVGDPNDATARWRFDLEPVRAGTRLTMWAQMGPGPSGVLSYIERHPDRETTVIERRLGEWLTNMRATIEGIKALAEEPGSA